MTTRDSRRVVAVGGGHGLAGGLAALRLLDVGLTAVVTTADDGGSSGRLRRDLDVIALGDLRMALLALASKPDLAEVLALRFPRGELEGHALGNLLLLALAEQPDGDVTAALDRAGALLGCVGDVLPATTTPVKLKASVSGYQIEGQANVTTANGRIDRVWIEPATPPASAQAIAAVQAADAIVIGPGSLFTSLIAALLVPELATAVAEADAPVVYLANLSRQRGETAGLNLDAHVRALLSHLPGLELAAVIAQSDTTDGVGIGTTVSPELGVGEVVVTDLVAREADGAVGYGHDPERLARAVQATLGW